MTEVAMGIKSLAASAGFALLAVTGLATQADAKTHVHIGVGIGVGAPGFYDDCDYSLIFHDCYYGRWPGYGFHDRYYGYRGPRYFFNDEPRYYGYRQMSCNGAIRMLRNDGYRNVVVRDCTGKFYSFNATRSGRTYKLSVNARTGDVSRQRR
jgi:hypothetical protein